MRCSLSTLAAAAALPAVQGCVSPETHACASAMYNNQASAAAFCATYSAGASVPSLFASACDSNSKSLSSNCGCYGTGSGAATSAAAVPTSTAVAASSPAETTAAGTTLATSVKASSAAASTVAAQTSSAAVVAASSHAAAASGGATAIATPSAGAGVGGTTCTVTDLAGVTASQGSCSNLLLSGVAIPASSTLSVTAPSGGALLFAGTMTVGHTPDTDYTPIVIKGTNAIIAGLEGAVIDGNGADYWDGEGSNGGTDKPDHFIKLSDLESTTFGHLTIQNWPTHLFEITGCTDLTMTDLLLDNSAGDETDSDGDALGHNTDAFDVSSTDGLYVSGATVYNQDDCVAVNSGSNMLFENMYCSGGHGLSIGSVDSGVTISNVTFQDSTVIDSENACRIKTDADGSDSTVSDITYQNIVVSGITDYAIDLQQDYENGSPTGDPTTGITVSNVVFSGISGTVSGSDAYNYYILCGSTSSCDGITFTDISVSGGSTECSPSSLCSSL